MRHSTKSDKFFTEDERKRISSATRDAESRTIGEVAVMVVDSSDAYPEAEVIGGFSLGSLMSLALAGLFFHFSVWWYIPLSLLLFFPSRYVFQKAPLLKEAFIGIKRREHAVMRRAEMAFFQKGLYRTRKNTGVLFFLSLLERKVWVLADKGIYEKIDQETLNGFARTVSQGVREGRACDSLCDAIREAGDLLSRHFPVTPGDVNELSDEVMTE